MNRSKMFYRGRDRKDTLEQNSQLTNVNTLKKFQNPKFFIFKKLIPYLGRKWGWKVCWKAESSMTHWWVDES